jgi:hypothetical protein
MGVSGEKCDRLVGVGEMSLLLPPLAAFIGVIEMSCMFPLARGFVEKSLNRLCGICRGGRERIGGEDIEP